MGSHEKTALEDLNRVVEDLSQSSPGPTIVVDGEGRIAAANELAGQLLHWNPSKLRGHSIEILLTERSQATWSREFSRCLGDPEDWPLGEAHLLWLTRSDPSRVPAKISLRPLPGVVPTHVVVWIQDITEHHETEEALRSSERRFRIAAQHTADLIQEVDFENDELKMFGDIDKLMGYPPDGFPRTLSGWLDLIHPEDQPRLQVEFDQLVDCGQMEWKFSYRVRTGDGSYRHWLDDGTVTEFGDDGRPVRGIGAARDITESILQEQELQKTLVELEATKERLSTENVYLREEISKSLAYDDIVGNSETFRRTLTQVQLVAELDAIVLLTGETGTGKELLARALHASSERSDRPLIKVNCAALPSSLIESELFGHEKGAFSGATSQRVGRFELADGGTLFLDEISEIPLELQAKLLQVLQDGEFERLGSSKTLKTDVRIIAATNRDLQRAIAEGRFRNDLFYRLAVFPIEVPPLRERRSDIRPLCAYFLGRHNVKHGKSVEEIPEATMAALESYDWPGNVRELENLIERGLILSPGKTLRLDAAALDQGTARLSFTDSGKTRSKLAGIATLAEMERDHIAEVLVDCDWKVKGRGNAAERLGMHEATLRYRMKKLGIHRPGH